MRKVPIENLVSLEELKRLFSYDPETGLFIRLVDKTYNAKKGDIISFIDASTGYISFNINGRLYYGHRTAWFYMTGEWPDKVDHIDGVKHNNKWKNLRNGTHGQNLQNYKKANSNNKSGLLGAHLCTRSGLYTSEIIKNKKRTSLGSFKTAEEAHEAYLNAKRELHEFNTL